MCVCVCVCVCVCRFDHEKYCLNKVVCTISL